MLLRSRTLLTLVLVFACLYIAFRISSHGTLHEPPASIGPAYRLFGPVSSFPRTPHAIATFLTGQGTDDAYLNATRTLTYQFLHAPSTRIDIASITWLVLCSPTVPTAYKQRLQRDGATVVEVDDVPLTWWIRTPTRRWKEQFTKLRLFEITEYERILFMDADTLVLQPLSAIFSEPQVTDLIPSFTFPPVVAQKEDESPLPSDWVFAARSDNGYVGQRNHALPPLQTLHFGAGFWVAKPDKKIFNHLLSVMGHWKRFDPFMMEQSLLNYVYRRNGPMPWRELDWRWSATWPSGRDVEAGVKTLHEKLWNNGPDDLQNLYNERLQEAITFLDGRDSG